MKNSIKTVGENKVGTKTKIFSNTSSLIWNTRRRYK